MRPPPTSTLFPYTTLFRSHLAEELEGVVAAGLVDRAERGLDALRLLVRQAAGPDHLDQLRQGRGVDLRPVGRDPRSEEHTSELQSRVDLVCRLLLEKKQTK